MRRALSIPTLAALAAILLAGGLGLYVWLDARETRLQGRSVRAWAFAYLGPDAPRREEAAQVLRSAQDGAVRALVRMVRPPDPPLTPLLKFAEGRLPEPIVRFLRLRIRPADASAARIAGAYALGLLGPQAEPAVPHLAELLRRGQPAERWAAATALGRIATPAAVRVCVDLLAATNLSLHHPAVYALGEMGSAAAEAAPLLIQALGHPEGAVRASAADALGRVSHEPSRIFLAAAQAGPSNARREAMQALQRNPPPPRAGVPVLLELLEDPDPAIRDQAAQTLRRIAGSQPRVQEALKRLEGEGQPGEPGSPAPIP